MLGGSVAHRILYGLRLHDAASQLTEPERACLVRHAAGKRRLVEIGVFEGASTRLLVEAADRKAEIFGVDPFFPGRVGICWGKGIALGEIRRGARRNPGVSVRLVERLSHEAAGVVDGSFEFVFLDGDHSHEGIRRDWEDWSKRILPGGVIALHDTRVPPHNPRVAELGSYRYFESTIRLDPRFETVEQVDSLSVLRRR